MRKTLLLKCEELYKVNPKYDLVDMAIIEYMEGICAS